MLEKAATMKIFEYSALGAELKKQTRVAEKQYQNFVKTFEYNKKEQAIKKIKRSHAKSNLVYNHYFTFYKYNNIKWFAKGSFNLKLNDSKEFKDKLELLYYGTIEIKSNNEDQIKDFEKRIVVTDKNLELYNKLVNICKTKYDKLTKARNKKIKFQNVPEHLPIDLSPIFRRFTTNFIIRR